LDLNNDNEVDYLRVIESTEGRTHIIVVQSVLGKDLFQDVATVEVEKDSNNRVQVQVVGDVYMYGDNYIYEPVYVHTPVIYTYFWTPNYRPYCSSWYWGYYPTYYYAWSPFPIFRYRSHIGLFINFNHHYDYVSYRRCHNAYVNYYGRRANGYERQYPNRSFTQRHSGYANRYELDKTRTIRTVGRNNDIASNTRSNNVRNENAVGTPRGNSGVRSNSANETPRTNTYDTPRGNSGVRSNSSNETPRTNTYDTPRGNSGVRSSSSSSPKSTTFETPRGNSGVKNNTMSEAPRGMNSTRSESGSRGNSSNGSSRGNSNSGSSRR